MAQRTDTFDLGKLGLTSGEGRRFDLHAAAGGFEFGGQRYATVPELAPVRLDVSRTTANGYALRIRFEAGLEGPCWRCLEPATPRFEVDAREVSQPGSGDDELTSPYVDGEDDLDLRAWVRDHLPARLRRPVPAVRGESQRRSRPCARARARPALRQALGDPVRVATGFATLLAAHGRPEAEAVAQPHVQAPRDAQDQRADVQRVPAVPQPPPSAPGLPDLRVLRRPGGGRARERA